MLHVKICSSLAVIGRESGLTRKHHPPKLPVNARLLKLMSSETSAIQMRPQLPKTSNAQLVPFKLKAAREKLSLQAKKEKLSMSTL